MAPVTHDWTSSVPTEVLDRLPLRPERLGDHVAVLREPEGHAPAPPVDCTPSGTNRRRCSIRAVRATDNEGRWWTLTPLQPLSFRPHPILVPNRWPDEPTQPADGQPVGDLDPDAPVAVACMQQRWAWVVDQDLRCRLTDLDTWADSRRWPWDAGPAPVEELGLMWRHRHPAAAVRLAGTWVWPDWLVRAPEATAAVESPAPGVGPRHALVGVSRGRAAHLAAEQVDITVATDGAARTLFRATLATPEPTACGKDPLEAVAGTVKRVCAECLAALPDDSPVRYGHDVLSAEGVGMLGPEGTASMIPSML